MLPQAFLERVQQQLGPEYEEFLASYDLPRAVGLRINPLKWKGQTLPFTLEPVPWAEYGFRYEPGQRPGLHPWHEGGLYYLQEPSAMAPAALLNPQPGERVLDLCAAPGGKSTQIAGKMAGKGLLVCNEYSPKRAKILSQNIERMGISNALVLNETVERLAARFPGWFHRIVVDAPCSGEGMFRKEAAALEDWSLENVELCARRQTGILDAAAKMLAPGGTMVYSTCTFAPEEDELAVAAFLERNPEFSIADVEAPWFAPGSAEAPGTFRLWPHKLRGEGHYAAVLVKNGGEEDAPAPCKEEKLPKPWLEFAKELGIQLPEGKAVSFGDTWYWAPAQCPDLKGLKVLRPGLELGQCKGNRFQPAHALALWADVTGPVQELTLEQAHLYQAGETLPGTQKGWLLMSLEGVTLGWAKGADGMLKNHYPKGLRRRNG